MQPHPPYDLALTARLMARYHGVLETVTDDGYYRAIAPGGVPSLFRASQPAADAPLTVTVLAGDESVVRSVARRMLCVEVDFAPFYAAARTDARLWAVVSPLYGLHHLQAETVFGALVQVIIEQQISLVAALRAQRALAEWGGRTVDHDGQRFYSFPTPDQLAQADPADLHQVLKITRRRVAVIQSVAQAIVGGTLNLEALRDLPGPSAYQTLMAINGVGHWTACWTLIRGQSCYYAAAHNDVALRDAVAHYFFDTTERVSAQTVAEVFAAPAPYSGQAAFYTLMRWAVERY